MHNFYLDQIDDIHMKRSFITIFPTLNNGSEQRKSVRVAEKCLSFPRKMQIV